MSVRTVLPAVPLARNLASHGDRPALLADTTLSYRDLADQVAEAAARLGPTRRLVLIEAANEVDALAYHLAVLSAGHVGLLVPDDKATRALISTYDPDVVVRKRDGAWRLEERRQGTVHDLHPDLALLLSTSGSTGSPKLVRLSHDNLQSNAESIATYLDIRPTDRAATTLPMSYCYGLSVIHSHLLRGAGIILTDLSVVDPCFWDRFCAEQATTFAAVPYTFELLERVGFESMDLPSLRYITQAGGRLAPDQVRRYASRGASRGWDLVVMYGQTEATARMAYLPPALAVSSPQAIGIAIPGGRLTIDPVDGAAYGVGEIVYDGPNVMLGYAERPEDLGLGRTVHRLRTGDLGRLTEDGLVEVVGRASRFVKVLGLRVDLGRVEAALESASLPGVCVDVDDQLVVALEGDPGEADERSIRAAAARASSLPHSAVRVVRFDALPRVGSGKIDQGAVRAECDARPAEVPADGDLESLRRLYADVLDRDDVTASSTFVGLGGDSMSYVALSLRLERALGTLPSGWHTMSLQRLADGAKRSEETAPARRWPQSRRDSDVDRRTWWAQVETSVVLRALAILLIVGSHIGVYDIRGGAHLLIGVAGYNLARFHLTEAPRSARTRHLAASLRKILLPTLLWIGLVFLIWDEYGAHVFFVNSVVGENALTPELRYWFVESLLWFLAGMLVLVALPAWDRLQRRYPFGVAMGALAVGLVAWVAVETQFEFPRSLLSPGAVLWLFALGWAMAAAGTRTRLAILSAGLVLAVPWMYDNPHRAAIIIVGMLLLAWVPTLPLPRFATAGAGVLASASLYIYLTHYQVYPPIKEYGWVALAASVLLGVAFMYASGWGMRRLSALGRSLVPKCPVGPLPVAREGSRA